MALTPCWIITNIEWAKDEVKNQILFQISTCPVLWYIQQQLMWNMWYQCLHAQKNNLLRFNITISSKKEKIFRISHLLVPHCSPLFSLISLFPHFFPLSHPYSLIFLLSSRPPHLWSLSSFIPPVSSLLSLLFGLFFLLFLSYLFFSIYFTYDFL